MLRKFNTSRSLEDNLRLGTLTAFVAGMVNIVSLMIFFSFTSNVTGHYAILASEIVKGNIYQVFVVFSWIFLFFFGNFCSNLIVINVNKKSTYWAHALPLILESICLLAVGFYGDFFYKETLSETESLVAIMLFSMGLQNGLTASISNFAVKTTHLTGATTDLGILLSMFTQKQFRSDKRLRGKAQLILSIAISYVLGGVFSGYFYLSLKFKIFYLITLILSMVMVYDLLKIWIHNYKVRVAKSRKRFRKPAKTFPERNKREVEEAYA